MPFATNPVDGCRVYFEDDGGDGPPVVFMGGFTSSTVTTRLWPVAQAMGKDYRHIYIDQRGHGRSDKPHESAAYAMRTRVADVVAVLDSLNLERAHFVAASYGAKLCFGVAVFAPDRVASLTAYGMHPGAIKRDGPVVSAVARAMASSDGMEGFIREMGVFMPLEGPAREILMRNDHAALAASWTANLADSDFLDRLGDWSVPCLLCVGTADPDFYEPVKQAAREIPGAVLLEMPDKTHFSGFADQSIVPRIKGHIAAANLTA